MCGLLLRTLTGGGVNLTRRPLLQVIVVPVVSHANGRVAVWCSAESADDQSILYTHQQANVQLQVQKPHAGVGFHTLQFSQQIFLTLFQRGANMNFSPLSRLYGIRS